MIFAEVSNLFSLRLVLAYFALSGHAQDLAERGRTLSCILRAGDWRSSAFMAYLDTADIEASVHVCCCPFYMSRVHLDRQKLRS